MYGTADNANDCDHCRQQYALEHSEGADYGLETTISKKNTYGKDTNKGCDEKSIFKYEQLPVSLARSKCYKDIN